MPSQTKVRKFKKAKLGEGSAVANPMQEPALADQIKNKDAAEEQLAKRKAELEKSEAKGAVITSAEDGHTHLITPRYGPDGKVVPFGYSAGADTSMGHRHDHPFTVSEDGNVTLGESFGHTHTVSSTDLLTKACDKEATMADEAKADAGDKPTEAKQEHT